MDHMRLPVDMRGGSPLMVVWQWQMSVRRPCPPPFRCCHWAAVEVVGSGGQDRQEGCRSIILPHHYHFHYHHHPFLRLVFMIHPTTPFMLRSTMRIAHRIILLLLMVVVVGTHFLPGIPQCYRPWIHPRCR